MEYQEELTEIRLYSYIILQVGQHPKTSTETRLPNQPFITPFSKINHKKQTLAQLVKILPAVYRTRRFSAMFTRARHRFLSQARRIQSTRFTAYTFKIYFNNNLPRRLRHPSSVFPKVWYALLILRVPVRGC